MRGLFALIKTAKTKPPFLVQILDPAVGTGTFLAGIIRHIKPQIAPGLWPSYVRECLVERLFALELLMAPYVMAHLQLGLMLKETLKDLRLKIFLTNTLQDYKDETHADLFSQNYLEAEENGARIIKKDARLFVVLGNPPYLEASTNKDPSIMSLMEDYKKEPSGGKLDEKNIKSLNDDYVKFIRYAQSLVQKNGQGLVAFITPHGFLDAPTFRGMRFNLLQNFDAIYVLDLHGNARKKEACPDGSKDENVFSIMQGVCITFFVRHKKRPSSALGRVYHSELWGLRDEKLAQLEYLELDEIKWTRLDFELGQKSAKRPSEIAKTADLVDFCDGDGDDAANSLKNMYYFKPMQDEGAKKYFGGFALDELFTMSGSGIKTHRDDTAVQFSKGLLENVLNDFKGLEESEIRRRYKSEAKDSRDKKLSYAQQDIEKGIKREFLQEIIYRPFDTRFTYYTGMGRGFLALPRKEVMQHLLPEDGVLLSRESGSKFGFLSAKKRLRNLALIATRGWPLDVPPCFISDAISDRHFWSSPVMQVADAAMPLFIKVQADGDTSDEGDRKSNERKIRYRPNINEKIARKIAAKLGLRYEEKEPAALGELMKSAVDTGAAAASDDNNSAAAASDDNNSAAASTTAAALYPLDLLGYIYATLHSPSYRATCAHFLARDFPRVPYPRDAKSFYALALLGLELIDVHLMTFVESVSVNFPIAGSNLISQVKYQNGRVYINEAQYFDGVSKEVWDFYIGGYQPAQKWLKDRKNKPLRTAREARELGLGDGHSSDSTCALSLGDLAQYAKILQVLGRTRELMQKIDELLGC